MFGCVLELIRVDICNMYALQHEWLLASAFFTNLLAT